MKVLSCVLLAPCGHKLQPRLKLRHCEVGVKHIQSTIVYYISGGAERAADHRGKDTEGKMQRAYTQDQTTVVRNLLEEVLSSVTAACENVCEVM